MLKTKQKIKKQHNEQQSLSLFLSLFWSKKKPNKNNNNNKQTNKQKAVNNKSRKKHLTFYFIFEKKQDLPDNCKLALPSPGKNLFHIKQNHFVLMHQCSANCSQTLIDLHLGFNILPYCLADLNFEKCLFVGWLLNVQATCQCISGTDLLRQVYMLPHWDRSCRWNVLLHPVTVYWHRADQSQCWPYNARRLVG